ncbi:MAG: serine hydrolase [Pseudomonadota bacterium]
MTTSTSALRVCLLGLAAASSLVHAYPLDGYDYTQIRRLEYYRLAQRGELRGRQLPPGAQAALEDIAPAWEGSTDLDTFTRDEAYEQRIRSVLEDASRYGVTVIDLTDPEAPRIAEHNAGFRSNVGSVGKSLVAVAFFQELADLYPNDIAAREQLLRETHIVADEFINYDHHEVPIFDVASRGLEYRALRVGDEGSLWEYLDWMLSASSNAAAAMVQRELMLLAHFGADYPPSDDARAAYFEGFNTRELQDQFLAAMSAPLERNGIDTEQLRQGSFFTRHGKNRIGGITSYGTPHELAKLLLKLEAGTLVDAFSSREIKRLLYMTQKRIRYASHPALNEAAVYFKSGSLYSCQEEEGFTCGKYKGNRRNILASIAIVESPAGAPTYRYLVAVVSNVLKVNSAVAHQTFALRVHRMIEAAHAADELDTAGAEDAAATR